MLQKIIGELHFYEKKVLKAFELAADVIKPDEIVKSQNIDIKAVMSAAGSLSSKNIIKVHKDVDEVVTVTEVGKKYAEEMLPDRWIHNEAYKAPNNTTPVSNIPPGYMPGIGWLRKRDYAYVEEGMVKLTDKGLVKYANKYPEEELLEMLIKNPKISVSDIPLGLKEPFKNLKKRKNVIKIRKVPTHTFKLTETGQKILEVGIDIRDEATQLTHEQLKTGSWRDLHYRGYDINADHPEIFPGKMHPLARIIEEIRNIFLKLGFAESTGSILESAFWNFDCLFQPQDHAAREMQDTFYIEVPKNTLLPPDELVEKVCRAHEVGGNTGSEGWGYHWDREVAKQSVLRTHTTCVSARYLARHKPPLKMFSVGKVFRRETVTYKHLPEFYQVEGIVASEDINFRNLLGILEEFYHKLGFKVRFRPAYFPYTYLSTECEIYLPDKESWIELGGSGMFRPEVLEPLEVETPVAAFGLGIERLAMIRLGIKDIRMLYQSNIGWLRHLPVTQGNFFK